MKKVLTIILAWASLAVMFSFVAASSFKSEPKNEQVTEAEAVPTYGILTTLRSMGLNPIGEPVRRGPYFVMHAYDRRGVELRVVADAQFGDILSVAPVLNSAARRYQRGPRIIHVPQADATNRNELANDQVSINNRVESDATNDNDEDDDDEQAAPPRSLLAPVPQRQDDSSSRQRVPRWQPRSEAPLPQPVDPRRAVLSTPTPKAEGPTPVRPTPRFNTKGESADKFSQPRDTRSNAPPPVGYSPPSEAPHGG